MKITRQTITTHPGIAGTARAPFLTGLLTNPVIGAIASIVGSTIDLFRSRRAISAKVERLKLETYRSRPCRPQFSAMRPPIDRLSTASRPPARRQHSASARPPSGRKRPELGQRYSSNKTINQGGTRHA